MGTRPIRRTQRPSTRSGARKRKNYRLPQSKLDAARRVLGTTTETETIEQALDLVVFGDRLASGTARARGRAWNDVVGEMQRIAPEA
jgi:predicted nucleic acid-binding protein